MVCHNIIDARHYPETKPSVHKKICSRHEFRVHKSSRIAVCNVISKWVQDFNVSELLSLYI
jgi:hypothetical protein